MTIQEENLEQPKPASVREKLLMLQAQIPSWDDIKSNEIVRTRAKRLALLLAVISVFYLGLDRFLGPQWPESNLSDYYRDEFVTFNQEDWRSLGGEWVAVEGQLIQNNFIAADPAIILSLQAQPEDTINISASIQVGEGGDGGGVRFNLWSPEQIARSHQVSILRQRDQVFLVGGYYGNSLQFTPQFKLPIPDIPLDNVAGKLKIIADQKSYDVYLNDQPMIMGVPSLYPPGWHGLAATGNTVAFNDVEIQVDQGVPTEGSALSALFNSNDEGDDIEEVTDIPVRFVEGDLIKSNGDSLENNGWGTVSGTWIERNGKLLQTSGDAFDARVTFDAPYKSYRLDVDLWHPQASGGGGIIFGLESPDSFANAYLMRFAEDGSGIFIGQYDENSQFQGIDFKPVEGFGREVQSIGLLNNGTTFEPLLNGEAIFEKLPRTKAETYIGLVSNQAELVVERVFIQPFSAPQLVTSTDGAGVEISNEGSPVQEQVATVEETSIDPVTEIVTDSSIPINAELENITGDPFFQSTFLGSLGETKWVPFRGEWSIDSGALVQTEREGFDFAIGYDEQYENFVLRTQFTHLEGQGGGVLFAMTRPDSRNLSHVVRYDSGQSAILFGYFDENGQFAAQGGEAVPQPGTDRHQLDVVKTSTTYDIYVDGLKVIGDIPLQTNGSFIGLTNSTSVVRFDSVEVFPLNTTESSIDAPEEAIAEQPVDDAQPETETVAEVVVDTGAAPAEGDASSESESDEIALQEVEESAESAGDGEAVEPSETESIPSESEAVEVVANLPSGATPLSGEWSQVGDEFLQLNTETVDHILALNEFGTTYTLEVELTMNNDSDAQNIGAGIIFNASQPDSKNNGQLVRFLNGGAEVIWGFYDENGRFNGQSGSEIDIDTNVRNTLAISVRESTYDILVNDQIIASELPLQSSEGGYLHLVTFRGPVTIHDVNLTQQEGEG